MSARILMIDDEPLILKPLAVNLAARGYELALATTAAEGMKIAAEGRPDVILLDLGLPDLDGVEVVKRLRTWSNVPIIILSVRNAEREKVAASLATLRRSITEIEAALGRDPANALLQELLVSSCQEEMRALTAVREAGGQET